MDGGFDERGSAGDDGVEDGRIRPRSQLDLQLTEAGRRNETGLRGTDDGNGRAATGQFDLFARGDAVQDLGEAPGRLGGRHSRHARTVSDKSDFLRSGSLRCSNRALSR